MTVSSRMVSLAKGSFGLGRRIVVPMYRLLKWSPQRPIFRSKLAKASISPPKELQSRQYGSYHLGLENEESLIAALLREAKMDEDKTKLCMVAERIKEIVRLRAQADRQKAQVLMLGSAPFSGRKHHQLARLIQDVTVNAGFRELPRDELYSCFNGYDPNHGLEVYSGVGNLNAWVDTTPAGYVILLQNGLTQWLRKCTELHPLLLVRYLYASKADLVIYRLALLNMAGCGVYSYLGHMPYGAWLFLLSNGVVASLARLSFRRQEKRFLRATIDQMNFNLLASQAVAIEQILGECEKRSQLFTLKLYRLLRKATNEGDHLDRKGIERHMSSLLGCPEDSGLMLVTAALNTLEDAGFIRQENGEAYIALPLERASLHCPSDS